MHWAIRSHIASIRLNNHLIPWTKIALRYAFSKSHIPLLSFHPLSILDSILILIDN
uniref:Uncharacterized protein n=1 Tax=Nelumbo nucifera TaxID=4432 RepID=A0A822Y3N4_NELNU|nr:TPA_asm: hypothetical protein HUJ06_025691 [Nelumbo nucifera]